MQLRNFLIPLATISIAACSTQGPGSTVDNALGSIPASENAATDAIAGTNSAGAVVVVNDIPPGRPPNDAVQDPRAYCPKTVMRAGTETLNIYPDGMKDDDPERARKLRFRATITDVARECNYAGEFINMKVGVAGRALSGPTGEPGDFVMPLRIAVTQGDTVLYSNLKDIQMVIPPGRTNGKFSYVDGAITIPKPESENIIIHVGFDEQRTDDPKAAQTKRPIN